MSYHRYSFLRFIHQLFPFMVLFVALLAVFGFGRVFIVFMQDKSQHKANIVKVWNDGDYDQVLSLAEQTLEQNPLNSEALTFAGLASYNKAFYSVEYELKYGYLEQAIFYLRRRLMDSNNNEFKAEVCYTLGKAYYSKGSQYASIALQYLNMAKDLGYSSVVMSQYFGLIYIELGQIEDGVAYFLEADGEKRSDQFYLSLAKAFANVRQFLQSERYYLKVIKDGNNDDLKDEAIFSLGLLYLDFKRYTEAKEQFEFFLEKYPEHSAAHFNLGEIYYFSGQLNEAKREWQIASQIDPSNSEAIARLRD